jgi:hypothetical protein
MLVVAGTPVIDSPYAFVSTSLPPSVTRTTTACSDCFFIWSTTIPSMAAASPLNGALLHYRRALRSCRA